MYSKVIQILFHYKLLQDIKYSSLCYIVGPCFFVLFCFFLFGCPAAYGVPRPGLRSRATVVTYTEAVPGQGSNLCPSAPKMPPITLCHSKNSCRSLLIRFIYSGISVNAKLLIHPSSPFPLVIINLFSKKKNFLLCYGNMNSICIESLIPNIFCSSNMLILICRKDIAENFSNAII